MRNESTSTSSTRHTCHFVLTNPSSFGSDGQKRLFGRCVVWCPNPSSFPSPQTVVVSVPNDSILGCQSAPIRGRFGPYSWPVWVLSTGPESHPERVIQRGSRHVRRTSPSPTMTGVPGVGRDCSQLRAPRAQHRRRRRSRGVVPCLRPPEFSTADVSPCQFWRTCHAHGFSPRGTTSCRMVRGCRYSGQERPNLYAVLHTPRR